MRTWSLLIGSVALFLCACSAADEGLPSPEPSAEDRAAMNRELAMVTQALGEPTCGTLPADQVWDLTSTAVGAFSPDANYGHPTCTDSYIVDVVNVPAGGRLFRGGAGIQLWPDPFTCLLNWGYVSLWQDQGQGYVKISENATLGVWGGLSRVGTVCLALASVTAPTAGNYRIVTAAGFLFGPKQPVSLH